MESRGYERLEGHTSLASLQAGYIRHKTLITTITVIILLSLGCGIVAITFWNVLKNGRDPPDMLIVDCTAWTGKKSLYESFLTFF